MDTTTVILQDLADLGFTLTVRDGRLFARPADGLPAGMLERLRQHKAALLERLADEPAPIDVSDARAVWQAVCDRLEGDPEFTPDAIEDLRRADVRWAHTPEPACRCGSTTWRDVAIHGGRSVRRDCARCCRFLSFPVWHGRPNPPDESLENKDLSAKKRKMLPLSTRWRV